MTVLFASRFRVNGLGLLKPEPHESPMGETHQPGLLTPVSGAQCNYVHARWISGKATAQPFGFVCTVMLLDAGGCRELLAARRPCYLNNRGVSHQLHDHCSTLKKLVWISAPPFCRSV